MSLDRIQAALLGGAVGDALGAGVEFSTLADIRARFGPAGVTGFVSAYGRLGAITDDTQMTLFTGEGLIRAYQRFGEKGIVDPPSVIHRAYLRWLDTQGIQGDGSTSWLASTPDMRHRRAPGNTCLSALQSGVMGTLDTPINNSKGCGGVMRIAPIGLVIDDPFDLAAEAAAITHGHPSGFLSSGALAVMLRALVKGGTLAEAVGDGFRSLDGRPGAAETIDALGAAIALSQHGAPTPETVETLGGGWVGEQALAIAVYCALVAEDFDSGVILAANHSGDSDSTASIAGQLLGAVGGTEVIADRWLEQLELRAEIERIAADLHRYLVLEEEIPWDEYPGS
ncbi:MAG: ADP-ribosylglycohydrolase family protein [Acidimicrobiia bacterium]